MSPTVHSIYRWSWTSYCADVFLCHTYNILNRVAVKEGEGDGKGRFSD